MNESASKPIRLVIVDDHEFLAETLGAWLARQPGFSVLGRAADGEAGLKLCLDTKPDLALVDINLPKMDGLVLVKHLLSILPDLRLLIMSGQVDPYNIWRVSQSGAHGYVEKATKPQLLLEAITTVASGVNFFSPGFENIKNHWLNQPEAFQKILSKREQEVLLRVVAGWNDERIAQALGIALLTVEVHRKNIRGKLSLHNDRDLLAYGRAWGLDHSGL